MTFAEYFNSDLAGWNFPTGTRSRNEGSSPVERHEGRRNYFDAFYGEIEYSNGPLYIDFLSDSYVQPSAPDVTLTRGQILTANNSPSQRPTDDMIRYRFGLAAKYFNGRYFFNAEVDSFNRWRSGRGSADPANGSGPFVVREGRNGTAWMYGVESGAVAGPSKATLNYVRATGKDPSHRFTSEDAQDGDTGLMSCYMKGWGYLMYYMYGAGDGWDAAGWGQPTNLHHVGARLDYAIAANLNLFGIYSYAWRDQPNAYRLGGDFRRGARPFTNEDIRTRPAGVQAVPDHAREIGWEVDLGVNWKLLEGLTWNTTIGYWKPGNWWAYAYPNTAAILSGGFAADSATEFPIQAKFNAGRDIDPLVAIESSFLWTF